MSVFGPLYRVQLYSANTASTFGVSSHLAEFENVKNIGYARYLNDVGEAFFTINQDDPKLTSAVRSAQGTAHVKIQRRASDGTWENVWRGILSEHEATEDDVIFYAYGYESVLYWLQTKWNQVWTNAQIDTIVTALWTYVKGLSGSQLGFVTTGTIQAPVTTSGGSTAITLPSYKAYYKRALFVLKELVAVGLSDTTNTSYFEFAYSATETNNAVTFNFWKNRSTDRSRVLAYGTNVVGFMDRFAPILTRNDLYGVGSGAHNQLFRSHQATTGGALGSTAFGLRQEPLYLTWVRDQTDLDRVTKLRAARAQRADQDLTLRMLPGSLPPLGSSEAAYNLGDRFPVKISRGITRVDKTMQLVGMQVIANRGAEKVYPLLLDRSGS